jgi:hypothetical protein
MAGLGIEGFTDDGLFWQEKKKTQGSAGGGGVTGTTIRVAPVEAANWLILAIVSAETFP